MFANVLQAQFTANNLVVVRVGSGDSVLTSTSRPVFIDEYTKDGKLVQSIPLPTEANGGNMPFTLSGSAVSEGALTRSPNGECITLVGYAVAPNYPNVSSSTSSAVNRVIARIDANGSINTSTRIKNYFSGSNVRAAVTNDGTQFWITGNSSATKGAGIVYITLGDSIGTQLLNNPNNTRCIGIFNEQLYATSGSSGYKSVFGIGTGLPTTTGQTPWFYPGFDTLNSDPNAFAFNSSMNVCYIADSRSIANGGGVQKWILQESGWTLASTLNKGISTGVYGLAVDWTVPFPTIYVTTSKCIFRFIDSADVSPTALWLDSASANTAFRGITFSPVQPSYVNKYEDRYCPSKYFVTNYPNPFNPSTIIHYEISESSVVSLFVYDILGRQVKELVNEFQQRGKYDIRFCADDLPGGIYFYRLKSGCNLITGKMILVK